MNWKDYFYFERRDRTTILILLVIIVIGGIVYFLTRTDKSQYAPQESAYQKQLDDFLSNLKDESQTDSLEVEYSIKNKYPIKLKVGERIEINSADTSQLKRIPGIGSSYANRIVKYRNLLGGYISVSQLREVWGVDEDLYKKISSFFSVKVVVARIKVNTASVEQLRKHPYINYKQAKVIVDLRHRKGKIKSVNRLALLDEFTEKDIERLKHYLSFE